MISKEIIKTAVNRLVKTYDPRSIYLFGSYAWGSPTDDSDLDLLIVVDQSKQDAYDRPVAGHHALWGLGISKDLIVYTNNEFENEAKDNTSLCHKIDKSGIKLYAKS